MLDDQKPIPFFRIVGMEVVQARAPSQRLETIFARFAVQLEGVELHGCALGWAQDGNLALLPPRLHNERNPFGKVRFTRPEMRTAIREEAARVYRLLTGGDLPEPPSRF